MFTGVAAHAGGFGNNMAVRLVGMSEVLDEDDRLAGKGADHPPLGELVDENDNRCNGEGRLSVAQSRLAASTVVVAYGRASSLARGIGSPVTSHIPY